MQKTNINTEQFCLALLTLGKKRSRAMVNYVMALAANQGCTSPVQLAMSIFNHYTYSNLTKILEFWEPSDEEIDLFTKPYFPSPRQDIVDQACYVLTHDLTSVEGEHALCRKDRQFISKPNVVIPQNTPISVGHPVSCLNLNTGEKGFTLPLRMERVGLEVDANELAVKQIIEVLESEDLPFAEVLNILLADSGYGKAIFLGRLYEQKNLIGVVRLRSGIKVYDQATSDQQKPNGASKIYGATYYLNTHTQEKTFKKRGLDETYTVLQPSIVDKLPSESHQYPTTLKNKRQVTVKIDRWNDMLLRTKDGVKMGDKPIDILKIEVCDAQSGKSLFKRPTYLCIISQRKSEIKTEKGLTLYRERYDIEPTFRFDKNNLLMDRLQTPEVEHLDTWLKIVQLAHWLLYVASKEIDTFTCPPWQKYLEVNKALLAQDAKELPQLTIAQTQKNIGDLFATFDKTPFLPKVVKSGPGREQGTKMPPRERFAVAKKNIKNIRLAKSQANN